MIFPKLKQIEKFAIDNSPIILTMIGVIGTIGTAVLTHKAATKAERILNDVAEDRMLSHKEDIPWPKKDKIKVVWKQYIPPVLSGTVTIGCIVMANRIGSKRAAAVAAAYAISERAYSEYREKVVERLGEIKEKNIRDELAQERVRKDPLREDNVVVIGSGEVLCYELYTGRYFNSSVEAIKKAQNETNYQINAQGHASVSDFYNNIGLPRTSVSDEMGWSSDKLMEIDFSTVLSEDGRPCVAIDFQISPVRDYHRFH